MAKLSANGSELLRMERVFTSIDRVHHKSKREYSFRSNGIVLTMISLSLDGIKYRQVSNWKKATARIFSSHRNPADAAVALLAYGYSITFGSIASMRGEKIC